MNRSDKVLFVPSIHMCHLNDIQTFQVVSLKQNAVVSKRSRFIIDTSLVGNGRFFGLLVAPVLFIDFVERLLLNLNTNLKFNITHWTKVVCDVFLEHFPRTTRQRDSFAAKY